MFSQAPFSSIAKISKCFRFSRYLSNFKADVSANYRMNGGHPSMAESECSYIALPQWIKDKEYMIYPPKSVKKKTIIGAGQFGTIFKGAYLHGNAM